MSILNLFYFSYWLSQPAVLYGTAKWIWVGVLLGFTVFGLISKIIQIIRPNSFARDAWRRFGNLFLSLGLVGLIWFFFRQEQVMFLAWRFWLIPWVMIFIWWLFKNVKYVVVRLPKIKAEQQAKELKAKYLPK